MFELILNTMKRYKIWPTMWNLSISDADLFYKIFCRSDRKSCDFTDQHCSEIMAFESLRGEFPVCEQFT